MRAELDCDLAELASRLWPHVEARPSGCWEWTRKVPPSARYGQFNVGRTTFRTHRAAWIVTFGQIPEGLSVCHTCDNTLCCNPTHLFLGTQRDNNADRHAKGRSTGLQGERHRNARLTDAQAREAVELYAAGGWSHRLLAIRYGVSKRVIGAVVRREAWLHIYEIAAVAS